MKRDAAVLRAALRECNRLAREIETGVGPSQGAALLYRVGEIEQRIERVLTHLEG
jgi:hypothetical protein